MSLLGGYGDGRSGQMKSPPKAAVTNVGSLGEWSRRNRLPQDWPGDDATGRWVVSATMMSPSSL